MFATPPAAPPQRVDPAESSAYVGGLVGSAHDFSRGDQHPRDLCLPCHAPHLPVSPPPRAATDAGPLGTYASAGIELDRASLLCMSCHDGVVTGDVFTSAHATRLSAQLGSARLGFGGLQGHPVGVDYPTAGRYHPPAAVEAAGLPLPAGRIQCTTCHDPHNTGRHAGLLVISNERSRLCLACHRL